MILSRISPEDDAKMRELFRGRHRLLKDGFHSLERDECILQVERQGLSKTGLKHGGTGMGRPHVSDWEKRQPIPRKGGRLVLSHLGERGRQQRDRVGS